MMAQTSTPNTTERIVSSVPLPPMPTLAELQSSTRSTAPASQGGRLMSLNSSILAAQRDWEQKRQVSGHADDGSSSYSDSPADSEGSDDDDSGSAEDSGEDREIETQSPSSRKRTLDSIASSSSPLPPTKRVLHQTATASPNSMSPDSEQASSGFSSRQLQVSKESMQPAHQRLDLLNHSHAQEAEPVSAPPALPSAPTAQATLEASTNSTPNKSNVDDVYTEYDAIMKPKDVRPNYFSYPELHAMGTIVTSRGAIIPTGYSTKHHVPGLQNPYICPVTGCLASFTNPPALGGHFSAAHKNNAYNDNCDGTLRRVGRFSKVTGGPAAAIVVSQIATPRGPTTLSVADRLAMDDEVQHRRGKIQPAAVEKTNCVPERVLTISFRNGQSVRSPALSYLLSFYGGVVNYTGDLICELSRFAKQRDFPIEWIECHQEREMNEQLFAISLAYLVGREVRGSSACNKREINRKCRLSDVCVALPNGLSDKNRMRLMVPTACVGCQYWSYMHKQSCPCDWTKPEEDRRSTSLPNPIQQPQYIEPRPVVPQPSAASSQSIQHRQINDANAFRPVQTFVEPRRSGRVKPSILYTELPPEAFTRHGPMQSIEVPPQQFNPKPAGAISEYQNPDSTATNTASPQLSMETWERAPGRLVDEEHNENIAFSNAFLTGREPVFASPDVLFNVIVVKPGDKARWSAESNQLRICSVAVGKVEVKLCNKVFHMGPNGMFVIRPGQHCVAGNDLYIDSVMHCTTVKDYELS